MHARPPDGSALRTSPRQDRWQVAQSILRSLRHRRGPVVIGPATAVLVGHRAPNPRRQRPARQDPELVERVDAFGADGAERRPVVAEVEDVRELVAWLQTAQLGCPAVRRAVRLDSLLTGVPSASVNMCRWDRSQRAKAASMACASCRNMCERAAAKTRAGLGQWSSPRP